MAANARSFVMQSLGPDNFRVSVLEKFIAQQLRNATGIIRAVRADRIVVFLGTGWPPASWRAGPDECKSRGPVIHGIRKVMRHQQSRSFPLAACGQVFKRRRGSGWGADYVYGRHVVFFLSPPFSLFYSLSQEGTSRRIRGLNASDLFRLNLPFIPLYCHKHSTKFLVSVQNDNKRRKERKKGRRRVLVSIRSPLTMDSTSAKVSRVCVCQNTVRESNCSQM